MKKENQRNSLKSITKRLFRTQMVLILTLATFLGSVGILLNIYFEHQKRDQNLINIAEAIAQSPITLQGGDSVLEEYLDSLKESLQDIDVISVVNADSTRRYHSNHDLIDSVYDGTKPEFVGDNKSYTANDKGPSGTQRRAYAAIYDQKGNYQGFVIAVMLMSNIREQSLQTILVFLLITLAAVFVEIMISVELSGKIKQSLLGYEPDVFTAMYQVRDNILESLNEGVLAIDTGNTVQFANKAAMHILGADIVGRPLSNQWLAAVLREDGKEFNVHGNIGEMDVLADRIPIREETVRIGTVGILHNRTEYTKLMEDLSGTRYLVDSMRANNHDFTNKLHVILGLIQMEMYKEATDYIENITIVQRATISSIMQAVDEPAVAALLIGKTARAAELNVKFTLHDGSSYSGTDLHLPIETLVTVIGNLIENAFESMNSKGPSYDGKKELVFGMFSHPGAVLITVQDTGEGIRRENLTHIFENGFSTKGEGRGTGLYQVKSMVEALGGEISVESQNGIGSSFSVKFGKECSCDVSCTDCRR